MEKSLNGKKIIFIGDSFVFYGNVVQRKELTDNSQTSRSHDRGYFYQLALANGDKTEVTNWTFGGHGLGTIRSNACPLKKECEGMNHMEGLTDRYFDYIIMSGGRRSHNTAEAFLSDIKYYMDLFRSYNSDAKFAYLVSSGAHNVSIEETFPIGVLNNLKTIEQWGVTVVDWGRLVKDIINGDTTVPGGICTYNKNSFVVAHTPQDGFHPNPLAGYITALMTYCALTGKSAVGQSSDFCGDTSFVPGDLHFDFDKYTDKYYRNGEQTNYQQIFESKSDMLALQQLVDKHLADKAYRNYDFK